MRELKMPERKVDVYNAYVGMRVKVNKNISLKYDLNGIGEIIQIAGEYLDSKLHSHQCVVDFNGILAVCRIGYDNIFDLVSVNDSNVVTIRNAKVGAEVIHKRHNKSGRIISIDKVHMVCAVAFMDEYANIVYIGNQNQFDLIFKTKKDGRKTRSSEKNEKSIKVQRFTSKIREGNRERGLIIHCGTGRAKCEGFNIQNKESIIKSKKSIKCIAS